MDAESWCARWSSKNAKMLWTYDSKKRIALQRRSFHVELDMNSSQPRLLVEGVLGLACCPVDLPVLPVIAIFSGFLPNSLACGALVELFQ